MKVCRLLLFLFAGLALGLAPPSFSQTAPQTITGTGCTAPIDVSKQATIGIYIGPSSWSGTIQPEVSIAGQAPVDVQVTPSTSSTAQSTITGNGVFTATVSGYSVFLLCGNTVTGTATVYFNVSTTSSAGRNGGSGGAPSGNAGGDLGGTYPDPSVVQVNGAAVPTSAGIVGTNSSGQFIAQAALATANQGFMISAGYLTAPPITAFNAAFIVNGNDVDVWQFTSPITMTIGHISININTGVASSHSGFGIYSADGTTKLVDTGAVNTAGTGIVTTSITPVTIHANTVYWFAQTATGSGVKLLLMNGAAQGTSFNYVYFISTSQAARAGVAGNVSSAGALPSSLGTITAATNTNIGPMAYVMFEP